jgi:hypothetical protein
MNAFPDQPPPDPTNHTQPATAVPRSDTPPSGARRAPLAFTETRGPVVVVCGLHGGAGTSTLALLLAHYAAVASSVPVLLCEAPAASGDQLALGAPESAVSLDALAVTLAAGARPQNGWWADRENLRVLATPPAARLDSPPRVDLSGTLQAAARENGLTVVDGGSVRDHSTRALLACATHVIWTLSIQPGAVQQASTVLASGLAPPIAAAQAFALRTDRRSTAQTRAVRDLRRVAESHSARQLLLLPYAPVLATRPVDLDSEPLHRALSSLSRFLQSP